MKKRGFTLVELLAVLVLIAAISLVVFPSIINYINSTKGDIDETTKKLIITGANQYLDDKNLSQELNSYTCFNLQTLIDNEYLEKSTIKSQIGNKDPNSIYIQAAYAIDPDLKTEKYNIKVLTKCAVYGDVNLDGKVDTTDFDMLKSYVKGEITLSEEALINADITLDNKVDVIDLAALKLVVVENPTLTKLPFSVDSDKFIFGDIDSDGAVTNNDTTIAQHYDAEYYDLSPLQKMAGDVNLDGNINVNDAIIIERHIAGLDEQIPII